MSERFPLNGYEIHVYNMGGFWYAEIKDERGELVDLLGGFHLEETANSRAVTNVNERTQ